MSVMAEPVPRPLELVSDSEMNVDAHRALSQSASTKRKATFSPGSRDESVPKSSDDQVDGTPCAKRTKPGMCAISGTCTKLMSI